MEVKKDVAFDGSRVKILHSITFDGCEGYFVIMRDSLGDEISSKVHFSKNIESSSDTPGVGIISFENPQFSSEIMKGWIDMHKLRSALNAFREAAA